VIDLLTEVRKGYDVRFAEHVENNAAVYKINKEATVLYNPQRFSNAAIAHELLHVWIEALGYYTSNHIYCVAKEHPKLSRIFSKNLCDHVGNCQEHLKMYPKYLEMGYAPESFIENSMTEQCSINEIDFLHVREDNVVYGLMADRFIGSLISIYAHHIRLDYSAHLAKLKAIETELFDIITAFWRDWERFDITAIDLLNNGFDEYERFLKAMKDWIEDKVVK
jgi:hypothetical protein